MSDQKRILVTGASGFIATHLVIQLLERGYAVRGTVRKLSRAESIRSIIARHAPVDHLDFVEAELMDAPSWQKAMAGCDAVMHVASPIATNLPKDRNEMIVPATEGTRNVLQAALDQGVERVVITSSVATIQYDEKSPEEVYTEAHHTDPENKGVTAYVSSKAYAEKLTWEMAEQAQGSLKITTIHPSLVLGPVLEKDYGNSAEVIKRMLDGSFPLMPKMGMSVVDVRDTAAMHILALENDASIGERIICSGPFLKFAELAAVLREAYPKAKIPTRNMPNWFVRIFSMVMPEMKQLLPELEVDRTLSWEKAKGMLGWEPRPVKEAILSTAETLYEYGILNS
ncbi:MAG: aldehyde reductase [Bacteroidota bacterium]